MTIHYSNMLMMDTMHGVMLKQFYLAEPAYNIRQQVVYRVVTTLSQLIEE
jgi:hypothetical protein